MNPLDPQQHVIEMDAPSGGPPNPQLDFTMQPQHETKWCWAACAASVGNYFTPQEAYTQCEVANTCQSKTTCCTDPAGCNQVGYLDSALRAVNSFHSMINTFDTFPDLSLHIVANTPVGTRVQWNGLGAHFTIISGTNPSGDVLTVNDSIHGICYIAYSNYPNGYHGGGTWTHTYFTQAN